MMVRADSKTGEREREWQYGGKNVGVDAVVGSDG